MEAVLCNNIVRMAMEYKGMEVINTRSVRLSF